MAYPYGSLDTDKADGDVMSADHAPVHNAIAAALNDLLAEAGNLKGASASGGVRLTAIEAAATAETAARVAADAGLQPLASALTAIAALTTTSFGRAFLALVDAAAARTAIGVDATGTAILKSLIDAAGDLVVGSAADTAARMAMGSALQVLRVNAAGTALEYAAPAGGAPSGAAGGVLAGTYPNPTFLVDMATQAELDAAIIAGGHIPDTGVGALTRTARWVGLPPGDFDPLAPTLSRLYYIPIRFGRAGTVDRLRVHLNTAVATSVARLGLYADHATVPHFPGALLVDGGTVATSSGQGSKEVTISQAVTAGLYWRAVVVQTAVPYLRASPDFPDVMSESGSAAQAGIAFYEAGVTGALPANATVGGTLAMAPVVELRFV